MTKILIADDDAHIRELVKLYLVDEGFEIIEASDGEEAWEYVTNQSLDMIVMDIMMPRLDGWELCRNIREQGNMPILMMTAKGETEAKIKGFQLGTDDYLIKPFDPMELVLRVKALLKRYRISAAQMISLGSLILDRSGFQIILKEQDEVLTIPLKEFELLYKLASYPGQLFTRSSLIQQIWGYEYDGDERTVDVHIKRLRERFEGYESDFKIVTIRGLGYRLEVFHD